MTRVYYKDRPFPAHTTRDIVRGDVLIGQHVGYGHKGETQIALKEMKICTGKCGWSYFDDERFY